MKTCGLLVLACGIGVACSPTDVIPNAPNHPANPMATRAPEADGGPAAPAALAHEGHGADDDGPSAAPAAARGEDHSSHGRGATAPPAAPSDENDAVAAAEKEAYGRARPVFEKYCAGCHSSAGNKKAKKKALPHFSMDTYPFGGHHADDIGEHIREVLGATGEKPTMPLDRPGAVKGSELDAVLAWSRASDKAHAAGPHHQDGPGGHQ